MIACENESCPYQWYHFTCVGIDSAPDGKWICPACSNEQTAPTSTPSPNDSGVDVTTPRKNQTATSQQKRSEEDIEAAEKELQNWMLTPLASIFAELAPASAKPKQPTLTQWYNRQTHFYALKSEETELVAAELEESDELTQRMRNLIPKLQMPKYITEMGVRMFSAGEMIVVEESEMLGPLHPSRVRLCDKDESKDESKPAEYFIKIVDPIQPAATKRELKFLHKIEKAGLDKLFNVPRIIGLVSPPDFNFNANANAKETNSPANIIAFLQTPIPSPIPLTTLLSPDIPQTKRTKWSRECQRIIRILHENDIVFGDCKADNFLVDRDDELWIIDFGGSYTEGWIDRELAETREGDRMALGKIVGVLEDPVGNTIGDGGDGEDEGKKRRRGEEEDGDADGEFESAVREKKARKA
ncbi:hypothetical protein BDV97DRAFT_354960 [Delphinella strobiligena]|nr:hypothetical protein BDV97DRAFT_354960 [Delphinella strobiligena]